MKLPRLLPDAEDTITQDLSDSDLEIEDSESDDGQPKTVWFEKGKELIHYLRSVSKRCLKCPGIRICVDEQMVRCRSRSSETHRIKSKPISEGFTFLR